MKQAVQSDVSEAQKTAEPTRSRPAQPHAVAPAGRLAQLADMMNGSPCVQALAQMKEDIQRAAQLKIGIAGTLAHGDRGAGQDDAMEDHGSSAAESPSPCGCSSKQGAGSGARPADPKQEKSPAQKKSNGEEHAAPAQLKENPAPAPNRTGLPDKLKAGVESLSRISLDDVKVHYNSAQPAQFNALAYAQGTDIHVAPGQEKHLPHEAWHIVQQKQGRVRPTMQMKAGVPVNDDKALEHEADVFGKAAASRQLKEKTVQAMPMPSLQNVLQCVNIKTKGINGLTHLVEMTKEGHIYNEDWLKNEREEARYGDLLQVDLDNAWYSRRGIHQEINWEPDKRGEPEHLWLGALMLNGQELGRDRYVREEMLIDPAIIHVPRTKKGVDQAIDSLSGVLSEMGSRQAPNADECKKLRGEIAEIKGKLHITGSHVPVDLEGIGASLEEKLKRVEILVTAEGFKEFSDVLTWSIRQLREAYAEYKQPKKRETTGGKISRWYLEEKGIQGIDLGGTGLHENLLDVNVTDEINDKNYLVLGDAMDLQRSFEPDCTDSVIAELLPLVDMETKPTVQARIQVIARVLAGVNYICPNGTARLKFNDNSGDARVGEAALLELAEAHGFTLERQSAVAKPSLADIRGGQKLLGRPKGAAQEGMAKSQSVQKPPEGPSHGQASQKPQEGLYRWFVFRK